MRDGSIRYNLSGTFRTLAWAEWGEPGAPVVLCVHGLTRNGRDFDILAQALADRFRVICPDLPGRGRSDWLDGPDQYVVPNYVVALSHLLAAVGPAVGWVGTSLGGLCGMAIAATPGNPIERLVLNDIGPFIPAAAVARIRDYMAEAAPSFANEAALEAHLRRVHAPFGALSDAQWAHLARHSARLFPDERLALHYDPAIALQAASIPVADMDLWSFWREIRVPRLVLRGADSDLLDDPTFERMQQEGAEGVTVPDCGHAPALMDAPTISVVRRFLLGEQALGSSIG